jgi:hypothetical protein
MFIFKNEWCVAMTNRFKGEGGGHNNFNFFFRFHIFTRAQILFPSVLFCHFLWKNKINGKKRNTFKKIIGVWDQHVPGKGNKNSVVDDSILFIKFKSKWGEGIDHISFFPRVLVNFVCCFITFRRKCVCGFIIIIFFVLLCRSINF